MLMSTAPGEAERAPFEDLGPDQVLDAVEAAGFRADGRFLALNSYENRVYQVGIEDAVPVVAKFYRPGRWSDDAIREEHAFSQQLADAEIPVVAPLAIDGETLLRHQAYRFAVFPRRGGRWPELDDPDTREWLGRFLGRIHAVAATAGFRWRPTLDRESYGVEPSRYLLEAGLIPPYLTDAYRTLVEDLLARIDACYDRAGAIAHIRLHGDCHPGNILWTDAGPHFVDLDDCRLGPAMQDLWMLLSGDRTEQSMQLSDILAGYEEFYDYDRRELHLIEALRTLRMIHYASWLARRWNDPAFPQAFPWFGTDRYWEDHVLALREQAALMDEPPLRV
jgi:Ser/Thr protein kinase RdoA (MazF antagonist)